MKAVILFAGWLAGIAPVMAQEAAAPPLPQLGSDTRAWLDLQKSASAQTPDLRAVPGEVAEQVYQRYINSFKYPIPQAFARETFIESGGSGGGGTTQ